MNIKNSYRTNKFIRKSGTSNIEIKNNKIKLPKLGWIKFSKSQKIKGKILNVTVNKTNTDKYFISIIVEEKIEELNKKDNAKVEWYGRNIIKIDTFFASSQLCNHCGCKNTKGKLENIP